MKHKLALKCGDKITLKLYDSHRIVTKTIVKTQKDKNKELILNSPYVQFLENLGLLVKPKRNVHFIMLSKFSKKRYFKNVEVLEIERKKAWYTTLVSKLAFWRKKI